MKVQLVDGWKQAWKWFSVQALGLATIVQLTWVALPADLRASAPPNLLLAITVALLVLGIAGRIIDQPVKDA